MAPNRTGEASGAPARSAVDHDRRRWSCSALLTVGGRLAQLARTLPLGSDRWACSTHWLEPVTGASHRARRAPRTVHLLHIGRVADWSALAVAIAVIGMADRVRSANRRRTCDKAHAPAETGLGRVLYNKYYVDEIYDAAWCGRCTRSRTVLWSVRGQGIIDGLVVQRHGLLSRALGWVGTRLQTVQVGEYAWVLVARCRSWCSPLSRSADRMREFLTLDRLRAWILPALVLLPLAGRRLCACRRMRPDDDGAVPSRRYVPHGWRSLPSLAVLWLGLWWSFDPRAPRVAGGRTTPWLPRGAIFTLGVDGISLFMVLLTTLLMPLAVARARGTTCATKERCVLRAHARCSRPACSACSSRSTCSSST